MALKIKAKGNDAKDLLAMKAGFRNAHSPQKDVDLMNGDNSTGAPYMKENPESRQAEDTNKGAGSDIAEKAKQTTSVNTSPETQPMEGFDVVRPVNRQTVTGAPERARRYNNQTRDMRTALGRGKPGLIVQE